MKTILKNKATRKNFLIIVALILLVILITRLFVIPQIAVDPKPEYLSYIESLLDKIFISLLVAVFIGLFIFYIEIPESEKKHSIIEPNRLNELFPKSRMETDFWYFSGGTGRFTRAETIPEISKISQARNEHRTIKILLIDPRDSALCKSYASFRKSLKSNKESKTDWSESYVRNEIIATICCSAIYKNLNPLLEISIYLKKTFSTLRIDLSKPFAIVTKEDKKEPALLIPEDTFLYRTYKEEILQTAKQFESVDLSIRIPDLPIGKTTPEIIKSICDQLQLSQSLETTDYEVIAKILTKNHNPYG